MLIHRYSLKLCYQPGNAARQIRNLTRQRNNLLRSAEKQILYIQKKLGLMNIKSRRRRFQVREITLDMASNMHQIAHICFPGAKQVVDRFHVQQLVFEAVQEMRIKARWKAIDKENIEISYAKACGTQYKPLIFDNGDTLRQLLARSRYLLFKKETAGSSSQSKRAGILFREYPDIA